LKLKERIKIFFELTKVKITSFVTVTTAFGYIAATGRIDLVLFPVLLGVLLLAFGSAALNHYQERDFDVKMDRTRSRPIPSGKILPADVLKISIVLILTGSTILFLVTNYVTLLFGLLNLIWYNLIYTPLKRKSAFAIIPGSLVGAIPPVIGWAAAGCYLLDPQIIIISFFFFIWQIPHFWLLLLVMDKDYQQAGFPTLTQIFDHEQLSRITFVWIISTAVSGLMIPLFGIVSEFWINLALFICGVLLTWKAFGLLAVAKDFSAFRYNFKNINYFALCVVLLVSIDKLIL
jgi:heme o synthase